MTEIVPHGYISVREAVNRLGPELFPEAWTGKEYKARGARRRTYRQHLRAFPAS
jgi:hypothetical protein